MTTWHLPLTKLTKWIKKVKINRKKFRKLWKLPTEGNAFPNKIDIRQQQSTDIGLNCPFFECAIKNILLTLI